MTASAMPSMFFKKSDHAPKKRRTRKTFAHHVKTLQQAPAKLRTRVTEELYKRNAELAVRNKTLALLRKLDEISLEAENVDTMSQRMVEAIAHELEYEIVTIAVIDQQSKRWRFVAGGSNQEQLENLLRVACKALSHDAGEEKSSIMMKLGVDKQVYSDSLGEVYPANIVSAIDTLHREKVIFQPSHSVLMPLKFGEEILGVLVFSSSRSLQDASRFEFESMGGIIGLISLALYKAKLYDDLQKTSAELLTANSQLKDLDKAKSEFLSIASHQLYTPLTALRGYISMILEGDYGPISDEQKPILDILNKSTLRLIELIKDLLDISRIESGRLELHLESVDLVEIATELVADLLPNAINKKLDLQFHAPEHELPHVVVDSQRIRQVMLNFVDNAIKYTPEGHVDVYLKEEGGRVTFSVTDTGRGLAPGSVEKLFQKFSRVGGSFRVNTEGTGLGLYVAKQIINEHRGRVSVSSPGENKGSTFSMELPIEGVDGSLKVGETATVVIKAADANGQQSA